MDTAQERLHHPRESLHEITKARSEKGLQHRLSAELGATEWEHEAQDSVLLALGEALEAHKGDTRGDHPYSTHLLRVAIRIMSPNHFNIRDDPDLVIAALLHDIIEDHPEYFLEETAKSFSEAERQAAALAVIAYRYGEKVAEMVQHLTNPILPDTIKALKHTDKAAYKAAKNERYQGHVVELLGVDTKARIIKLSDFIDNGVGLIHNENQDRALNLAHKYYPLIEHYREYIELSEDFSESVKTHLLLQMDKAEKRCMDIIDPPSQSKTDLRLLIEPDDTGSGFAEAFPLAQ